MDEVLGRKKRVVKLKKDNIFSYDEESIQFLNFGREDRQQQQQQWQEQQQQQQQQQQATGQDSGNIEESVSGVITKVLTGWSAIDFLPYEQIPCASVSNNSEEVLSQSLSQHQNTLCTNNTDDSDCFDNCNEGRNYSSTRLDFLDQYSILTVSPTVHSDSSNMAETNNDLGENNDLAFPKCTCTHEVICSNCTAAKDGPGLAKLVSKALDKMDLLTSKLGVFEKAFAAQAMRLDKLEGISSVDSASSSEPAAAAVVAKKMSKSSKSKPKKSSIKEASVEREKERQLRVMKEKLSGRISVEDSTEPEESESEPDVDLTALRRKMTKKQKEKCSMKVAARLKQAGGIFPEDEFDSSTTSGTDSSGGEKKHRSKRKVRSGAKIKKRPVIQTELWPHTIANEDDGEEVTSETIGLSKFLSCFTYIMVSCGKVEAKGRTALLHAVCSVFECLPWTEARAFHNLVMIKLEQGRIDWSGDFSALADQYLDKKVRLSLRSKGAVGGGSKPSSGYKSFGKGFGGQNRSRYNYNNNKNRSLYATVCQQWNYHTCPYGDRCRKLHVCWSCAETGKMSEQHKAPSHENATSRARQNSGV